MLDNGGNLVVCVSAVVDLPVLTLSRQSRMLSQLIYTTEFLLLFNIDDQPHNNSGQMLSAQWVMCNANTDTARVKVYHVHPVSADGDVWPK